MINIAFIGGMGSGKTTLAKYLAVQYDLEKISFATPLKIIARDILGREIDKKKDRAFLQGLGKLIRNTVDKDYWVRRAINVMSTMDRAIKPPKGFVIDDLRFKNELEHLKERGFLIIYLDCPENTRFERVSRRDGVTREEWDVTTKDTSETELNLIDCDTALYTGDDYGNNLEYVKQQLASQLVELWGVK